MDAKILLNSLFNSGKRYTFAILPLELFTFWRLIGNITHILVISLALPVPT
jgi:hypothetical protein